MTIRDHWRQGSMTPVLIGLVLAASLAARIPYLEERSIWYDEASSWQTAKFPPTELIDSLIQNVHLPLYYVLLKGWIHVFGESAAGLRAMSVLFGCLTVPLMFFLARDVLRLEQNCFLETTSEVQQKAVANQFGIAVAAVVALNPQQIQASIEARMYSLGTFLLALSTCLFLRLISQSPNWKCGACFALACIACLYTHHYLLFSVMAQFVALALIALAPKAFAGVTIGTRLRLLSVLAGAVAIAYSPAALLLIEQKTHVDQGYWISPMRSWKVPRTFTRFLVPEGDFNPMSEIVILAFWCGGLLAFIWRSSWVSWAIAVLAVLPMALSAAISMQTPIWFDRYFRFVELYFLLIAVSAFWRIGALVNFRTPVVCLAVIASLLLSVHAWQIKAGVRHPGLKGIIDRIQSASCGKETIIVTDLKHYFPAKFYAVPRRTVRLLQPPSDLLWGNHLIRETDIISFAEIEASLPRGIWIVAGSGYQAGTPFFSSDAELTQHFDAIYVHDSALESLRVTRWTAREQQ